MDNVAIATETIRLGQFLKLIGVVDDGAMAKALLQDGEVQVNGAIETRRGRQLRANDVIEVLGRQYRVSQQDASEL